MLFNFHSRLNRANLFAFFIVGVVFLLSACSATGESTEIAPLASENGNNNSGDHKDSSETGTPQDLQTLLEYAEMVHFPAITFARGSVEYKVSAYFISSTEVTQGLYETIMGSIAKEDYLGDDYPVFNVSWYDAVLFCNALSKKVGLDTAYIYEPSSSVLKNLSVNYEVEAVRLPTEIEWEVAARAGTSTKYYWDTDVASKYAYYGQTKGPTTVASLVPNGAGLYDVAGNVAEWVNDWFAAYPTASQTNYAGPAEGAYKCVRGGGWSDKASALAPAEREKKSPEYRSQMVGFRIVYSTGF